MRNVALAIASGALLCAFPAPTPAHGGGLDAYGCHHNRKAGGYHCHRGPLAGEVFMSKDAMLKELARRKSGSPKTPRRP